MSTGPTPVPGLPFPDTDWTHTGAGSPGSGVSYPSRVGYPAALVEFEGQAVPPDAIRSLEWETNVLWLADTVSVTLDNAPRYSDFLRKEMPVDVWIGVSTTPRPVDKAHLIHVFSGAIDGVLPSFGDDRTVTIKARDHTRVLIDSQANPGWAWKSLTDAGVVTALAQQAGLKARVSTDVRAPISVEEEQAFLGGGIVGNPQVGMSGWEIIQTLAIHHGYVSYVTPDKTLFWGPRALPDNTAILVGVYAYLEEPYTILAVDFDDSALVVNTVHVARWVGVDSATPEGWIGGTYVDAGRLKAARGRVIERTVISTHAAAGGVPALVSEAEGILHSIKAAAITAVVTLEGDPNLWFGSPPFSPYIVLHGTALGRFAGRYFLESATHRFSPRGYDTEIRLSSVEPEAIEVYRPTLEVLNPNQVAALTPDGPTPTQPRPRGDGPPVDLTADWPEFASDKVPALLRANGIDPKYAEAACGPIAAAGMLKAYGIVTDPGKLAARALQGAGPGKPWWLPEKGMTAGDGSAIQALLASQGLDVKNLPAAGNTDVAGANAEKCIPVIANFPNHYVLLQQWRASDNRFYGGNTSGNALKNGSEWMSLDELNRHPGNGGRVESFLLATIPLPTPASAPSASTPVVTAADFPLRGVVKGLVDAAPARLRAAIRKDGRWPREQWDNAAAISFNETGGSWKESAHKDDAVEDSRGVFQVNVRAAANPQYAGWNLFDYDTCAQAAYEIWTGAGNSWGPWSVAPMLGLA